MPAERPKNHHFVPQSYLRRFANKDKIFVFDKETEKSFGPKSVSDVAATDNFYTLPNSAVTEEIDEFELEKAFAVEVEPEHQQAIDKLISNENSPEKINRELRLGVARAIAFQYLRTRNMRNQISELVTDASNQILKLTSPNLNPQSGDFDQPLIDKFMVSGYVKTMHLSLITREPMIEKIALELTDNFNWWLIQNQSTQLFVTSDNPVYLEVPQNSPLWAGTSFSTPGVLVSFPINPRLLVILQRPASVTDLRVIQVKDEETAKNYNTHQVNNSERHVFSLDGNFSFINEFKLAHT